MNEVADRRLPSEASAGTTAADGAPERTDERTSSSSRLATRYRFDDPDMDLFFVIALGWGPAGGLSAGEAFYVASTIRDGDAASWVASFAASGDRQHKLADDWQAQGWKYQAAQARLKAFASYRSAWQFAPVGPVFDDMYAKHRAAFRKAIPDLGLAATFFDAPYNGKTLPGVFIQNADPEAPVALLLGGADTCFEEIFLTVARYVLESGYSIALADLPGQGTTMKDGFHWEAEPEKPIAAIVDLLIDQFSAVPGRMAMLGYSLGGYWAGRAAAYETRFGACMASTPLPRPGDLIAAFLAGFNRAVEAGVEPSTATQRNLETIYWKAGAANQQELLEKLKLFVADPSLVTVPFLSIVGAGEGAEFQTQSEQWHEQIRSPHKKLVRLDASTGADGHCQAANRLRMAQEMTGWMDTIFRP